MDEKKPGDKPKTAKSSANVFQRIGSAIKKTKEGREAKEPKSIFRSKKENAKPDAGAIDMQQEKSQPTKTSQQTSVVPPVVAKPIPPVSPKVDNAAQEHAQPQPQQPTPSAKVQPVSPGKRNRGLPQQLAAKPTYDPKALKKNTRAAPVSPVPPEVVKPVPVEPVQMAAQKQDGAKTLNVALIGDKGVGKTSIAARFAKDSPYRDVDGKKVELKVFDKPQSYEGMNGIVVVFDFQNKESFREAKRLIREVQENTPKEVDIILVGNKAGEEGSVVDYGEARGFAANHGIPFFANSVNVPYTTKEGRDTEYGNVSRLFDTAARRSVFFTEHPEERPERVLVKVPAKEETVEENKTSEVQLGPKPVTQSKATVVKEEPKKLSAEATKELVDKLIKEAAALLSPSPERIISAQDQLKPLSELIVKMEQQLLAELSDEQKQPLQENLEKLKAIMPEKIKAAFLEIKADKDKKFEKLMSGQVALSVMLNAKKDITRIIGYCGQYLTSEEDSHIKQELEALIKHLDDPINKKLADTIEKFKSVSQITDIAPDKLSSDLNDIEIVMLEGEQKEQLQQGLLLKLQDRYAKLEELLQGKASSEILAAKNKFYQDARSFLPDGNPLKQRIEDELFELINNPLKALESKEISLESFYELNVFEAQQKKQNLSLTEGQLARLKTIKKAITVKIDEAFKKTLAAPSIEILATSHLDIFRLTQSSSDVEKLIASLKSIPNPAEQLIVELDKISQSRALSPAQKAFALDRLMGNFQRIYGDVNKHALAKYNEISENLTQAIAENIYNAHQSAYNQCDFSKLWTAKEPSDAFTPVSNLTGKITLKMRDNFAEATSFESRILLTRRWLNVVGTLLAKHNLDLAYQIFAQLKVDAAPYLEKIAKEKGPDANLYQALLVVMDDFGNKANLKAVGEFFQNNNQSYLPTVAFVSNSVLTRKEGLAQSNPKEREELSKLLKQTIDGMAAELNSQKTQAVGEVELDQHFESSVTEEAINKKLDLLRGQKEKVEEGAKRKGLAVTDSKSTERLSSIQLLGLVGKTVGYAVAVDKTFQQAALKAKLRQIQKSDISESEKVLIAKLYEAVIEFRENIKGAIDEKWLGAEGEIAKIFREMDKVEPKSEAFKDALAFARESVKRRLEHLEKPLGEIRVALAQEDEFGVNPISALGTEPEFDRKEIGKLKSIFASKEARVFKEINELLDALSTFREQSNPSPKGAVVTALKKVEPSDVEGSMGKALNTAKQILQGLETQKIGKALESVEAKTYNILKSAISYAEKNIDARLSDPRLEGKGYSTSVTQVLSKVTAELPLDIVPAAAVVAEPKKDDKEKAEETGPLQRIPGSGKEVINELILLFNNLNKDGNHKELADLIPELGQLLDAERKNNTALVESNIGVVNNIIQKVPLDVPPLVVTPVLSRKPLAINEDQHASMLNTGYQYYEEDCAALTARFLEQKGAEVGSGLLPEIFVGADGTPMHVFVLEMTGASHNLVGAGRNLSYIFNKNTRSPDDVFLNLLDKIKNLNDLHDYDEVIRAHYGDQLEQEHAVLMTEAVSNKLKECHWDNAELKVFLDEREQERVGHDPIEDMAPYLAGQEKVTCRALFPFNLGGGHWILGEVDFIKNGKDITVKFNPHDPLGGGHFSDAEITEEFKSGIEGRLIQALGRDIKAKFENASNNEPARQVERVKVACGAFTMNDLFLRAENKPVGLPIADTTDLRKWQYGILRGKPAVAFTLAPVAAPVALAAVPKVHAPSPTEKPATQLSDEQLLAKIKTPEGLAEIYDRENNAIEFDGKKTRAHEASQRLSRLIPDTKAFAELNGRLLLLEAQKQITGTDNKFLRTGSLARECLERMMERTSPDFAEQLVNSYKAAEAKSPQPKVEQPAVEVKPEPKKSGLLNTLRGFLNRVASKPSSDVVSGPVMQQQPRTTNELKLTPEAFEEFLVNVLNVVPPEMKSVFQQLFVKGSSDKVTADGEAEQLMFFLKSLANKYLLSEAYGTDPREGAKLSERMKDNMAAGEKGNPNYKALLRELVYPVVKEDINTPEGLARILTASRQGNADVVLAKIYFPEGKTEEDNAALVALAKRLMQLEFADDPKNMLRRKSLAAECLREVLRRSDFVNQVYAHYQTFMKDKDSDKFQKAFFAAIPAAAKEIMGINCLPSEMSDETKKLRAQDLMFFASSFASRSLLNGKDFDPLTSLNFVAYAQNDMTPDNKEYADFLIGTVYSGIANDKAERNTAVLKVVDTLRDISPPLEEPQPKPEPTVSAKMDVEQVDVKVEKPVAPKPVIAKPETPKVESGPIPEGNKQRVEIAFDAMMLPLGDEKTDKKIYEIKSLLRQGTVDKAELEKELDELLVGLMAALAEEDKKPITVEKPKGLRNVVLARLTEPEAPMKTSAKYDSINGVIFHVKEAMKEIGVPEKEVMTLEVLKARLQEPEPKSDMHKRVLDFVGRHPKDETVVGFAKNYEAAVLGKDRSLYMMYASFLDAAYKKYGTDELFNSRELFNPVLSRAMDCADRLQGMLRDKKVDVAVAKNFLEQNLKVLLPLVKEKFPEQHKELVGEIREAASKLKDSKNADLAKLCNDILADKLFAVEPVVSQSKTPPSVEPPRTQEPEPKSDMHKKVLDFVGRHPKDEGVKGFAKNYEVAVLGKDPKSYMMYASFLDAVYKKYGTDELFNSRELFNPVLSRAMDCADRFQGMLRNKKVDVAEVKNFLEQNLKVLLPLVEAKFPEQHKEIVGEIREAASKFKDSKNTELAKFCNDILKDKLFTVEPAAPRVAQKPAQFVAIDAVEMNLPEAKPQIAEAVKITPAAAPQAGATTFNFCRKENWDNYW
ncbi:MAG TPA: hypothetical protein VGV92_04900, partial [Gammaproteobacteria bacterium]|nr:hypothetical protein [Gammaproteobacteria bacterium]